MQAMGEGHSRYRKKHRQNYPEGHGTRHFRGNAGRLAELGGIERYLGLGEAGQGYQDQLTEAL